ncbi:hypothetical protein OG874_22375 [Nocardia sp. NBC_00565]|uniref:hypothetical protein n=1 Tax=Nocardia sp. NBC_00565 TaxID=2975993 RepID=UPI002E804662|nr:hypothetical protein [Nocardia sp. NBC_00565]WUC07665.1 hypothetical protein OG874_22375 [Nocardia sp. NBC_00565]
MTKPIHFNYSAADAATGNIGSLTAAMKHNSENLHQLHALLIQEFEGSAAGGYTEVMNTFKDKLTQYDSRVEQLNKKLQVKTNSGGDMNQVDILQGNRFGAIKA